MALARAEQVQLGWDERELLGQLRNDLRLIRQEYQDPQARFAAPPTTREGRFRQALAEYEHISDASPVLRFALASYENFTRAINSLWNAACRDYMARPDVYDHVLGDFVPGNLRNGVRNHLAYTAYTGGANATAAEDWEAYRRCLRLR